MYQAIQHVGLGELTPRVEENKGGFVVRVIAVLCGSCGLLGYLWDSGCHVGILCVIGFGVSGSMEYVVLGLP